MENSTILRSISQDSKRTIIFFELTQIVYVEKQIRAQTKY